MREINLKPIGIAKNGVREPRFGSFADVVSEIVVDVKFTDALNRIEDYSHVIIVYWMDKVKDYVITHRPQGNPTHCSGSGYALHGADHAHNDVGDNGVRPHSRSRTYPHCSVRS